MAGQAHGKDASLAESRTLNPHPEAVTDPAFTAGAFFDPADLVQVKYEMVRAVEAGSAWSARVITTPGRLLPSMVCLV